MVTPQMMTARAESAPTEQEAFALDAIAQMQEAIRAGQETTDPEPATNELNNLQVLP